MDRDEVVGLLWQAARRGSVAAAVTLLRECSHREPQSATSLIDELADRRRRTR